MNSAERLFSCVDARLAEYKEFLKDIVTLESYSTDKSDVDKLGEFMTSFSLSHGFSVTVVPFEKSGNGLLIEMPGDESKPPVVLTGHIDTVFPRGTISPLFREEDGKFYGPGIFDMKGGIAIGMLAIQALKDYGYSDRTIRFIIVPDEEVSEGLSGDAGKAFIKDNSRGAVAAITLEGNADHNVTVGRKGSIRYNVHVQGKRAHAGMRYAEGISAIREAALKIYDIEVASDPDEITYNCGLIKGGSSPNTVPGTCDFTLYNRYWRTSERQIVKDHVEGIINKSYIPGTVSTFEVIGERPPMDDAEGNYALYDHINRISQKYGFGSLECGKQASGSDATYTAMAGVPSVCSMGIDGANAHSENEYALVESFPRRAKLLAAVIFDMPETLLK